MSMIPDFRIYTLKHENETDIALVEQYRNTELSGRKLAHAREAMWVRLWNVLEVGVRSQLNKYSLAYLPGSMDECTKDVLTDIMKHAETILAKWDPEKAKLSTYGSAWVKGAVADFIRCNKNVRLPEQKYSACKNIKALQKQKEELLGDLTAAYKLDSPTVDTLAEKLRECEEELAKLIAWKELTQAEEPNPTEHGEKCDIYDIPAMGYGSSCSMEFEVAQRKVLSKLPTKEVKAWLAIEQGYNTREAGEMCGYSHAQAGNYHKRVQSKLYSAIW